MPFERTIKRGIIRWLNSQAYTVAHSNPPFEGEPDIDAVVQGIAVKIECKQPGKKPTDLQQAKLDNYHKAGAVVGVAYSIEDGKRMYHLACTLSNLSWTSRMQTAKRLEEAQ